MSSHTLAILALTIALISGSAVPTATKIGVNEFPPLSFTLLRFLAASIMILPFFLKALPKRSAPLGKAVLFSLFLSANVILFPLGVKLTTASIGGMIYIVVPIIVAVLSYIFLKERFTSTKIVGIIVGFAGALLIVLLPALNKNNPFAGSLEGNSIVFLASICTAAYTVSSKTFQKHFTPIQLTSIFIFTTTLLLAFLAPLDWKVNPHLWTNVPHTVWITTLYVGIVGTSLWYLLYQYAIKNGSPLIASLILYLNPAANYVWAALLLHEKLTTGFVIGFLLACIGVYFTIRKPSRTARTD